jgi:ribosomal protein S18 acetylase RimI-like enzyme
MNSFLFRNANIGDIPFLVDTIVEAEKSGTNILTYTTIFGLSEEDTKKYLTKILEEQVDNCELSVSSFFLAEFHNVVVGAIAAWIEGYEGIPSSVLKGNLLNFTLPRTNIERALLLNNIVKSIHIEYVPNTVQIGLVYIDKAFRGQNLVSELIDRKINELSFLKRNLSHAYIQVFGNNIAAIKAYEKANFFVVLSKESQIKETNDLMPYNIKILMKRELKK